MASVARRRDMGRRSQHHRGGELQQADEGATRRWRFSGRRTDVVRQRLPLCELVPDAGDRSADPRRTSGSQSSCRCRQCEIVPNWSVLGMRGTGSHDVRISTFVPTNAIRSSASEWMRSATATTTVRCTDVRIGSSLRRTCPCRSRIAELALEALTELAQNKTPYANDSKLKHRSLAQIKFGRAFGIYRRRADLLHDCARRCMAARDYAMRFPTRANARRCTWRARTPFRRVRMSFVWLRKQPDRASSTRRVRSSDASRHGGAPSSRLHQRTTLRQRRAGVVGCAARLSGPAPVTRARRSIVDRDCAALLRQLRFPRGHVRFELIQLQRRVDSGASSARSIRRANASVVRGRSRSARGCVATASSIDQTCSSSLVFSSIERSSASTSSCDR